MSDPILEAFLTKQFEEGMALAESGDLLMLLPIHGTPPDAYIAQFRCNGLIRDENGNVHEHDMWDVGIRFPLSYLKQGLTDPLQVITWLAPENVWHPNINGPAHLICLGHMPPGTGLVELLYQIFDVITYSNVTMREDDALNLPACSWARSNKSRFPVDTRPLKRAPLNLQVRISS